MYIHFIIIRLRVSRTLNYTGGKMSKLKPEPTEKKIISKEILLDYIGVIKVSADSYVNIVKQLAEFQEKHEDAYESVTDVLDSPEKLYSILDNIKKINKDIFFKILEIMFKFSSLSNNVRNVFFLSVKEKNTLVKNLKELSEEIKKLLKDAIKLTEEHKNE